MINNDIENSGRPEDKADRVTSWALFVPEAIYDLVGRVIPGIVIVTAAILLGAGSRFLVPLPLSSGFTQVLIVITGFLFGLIGDVTADATLDRVLAWIYGTEYSFWRYFDHLDAAKRKVLLKLWAERMSLWNLLLGWLCLWIVRPPLFNGISNTTRVAVAFVLALVWLRWDWTCRARARTWAEKWKKSYGPFAVRGDH